MDNDGLLIPIGADIAPALGSIGDLNSKLDEGVGHADKMGGNLLGSLTSIINPATLAATAVVGIGTAAFKIASDVKTSTNNIKAALGVTGDEAKKLGGIATEVFAENWGTDMKDVSDSLIEVRKQMKGLSDGELKGATEAALALRDSFGTGIAESTNAANTLMKQFGLTSKQAFDFIAKGQQEGLNASGDFLDTIGEYSTQFSSGGAKADEFFSIMKSGLQGGVLGTDKAADAFKEFRVRIQDGSKTTSQALSQLGIDAQDLTQDMADGTMTAADAWTLVQQKLSETTDANVRMQAGVGLLGTQFEDLGTQGALALDMTGTKLGDMAGATDSLNAKYDNFGAMFEGITRELTVALLPLGDMLMDLAEMIMPIVITTIKTFSDVVKTVIGWIKGFVDGIKAGKNPLDMLSDAADKAGKFIMEGLGKGLKWVWEVGLPLLITKLGEWGKAFIEWIGPRIPPMLKELGNLLGKLGGWLIDTALPTLVSKLLEWGGAFIAWIAPKIPPLLVELGKLLLALGGWLITTALPAIVGKLVEWGGAFLGWVAKDVLPKLPGALGAIVSKIGEWVGGALAAIGTAAGRLGDKMVSGIKSGIQAAWNGLIDWLKNMLFSIPIIGDYLKQLWGGNTPQAPSAPSGDKPINTRQPGGGYNSQTVGTPGGVSGGNGWGGRGDIVIQIDGREVARAVQKRQDLVFGV